jgi:hypothetical protein
METISKDQWTAIQKLARRTRDSVNHYNKPGRNIETLYARSHVEARQLGYGGTAANESRFAKGFSGIDWIRCL